MSSGLLSRPLSPIIESPPTTPQKQPITYEKQVGTGTIGLRSLHPPPSAFKNPKSVTWGDLVAYRTVDARRDESGYRSPDTEDEAELIIRSEPKRFSAQSNLSTGTSSSFFSITSSGATSTGEDLPPLSAERIRMDAERTPAGGRKRRSGTKELFKRYVERLRPGKSVAVEETVQTLYDGTDGQDMRPVISILHPSSSPAHPQRLESTDLSPRNPGTHTSAPSLMSASTDSAGRTHSTKHQRSASIFIPPNRVELPSSIPSRSPQPVPPNLERQARISGTFGPPKQPYDNNASTGRAQSEMELEVPDEVMEKGHTETVRIPAFQVLPGITLDLGPALPISSEKSIMGVTLHPDTTLPAQAAAIKERAPASQAKELGWTKVSRSRPSFGYGRRSLSEPNVPTIHEFERETDGDADNDHRERFKARDRHELVRMLKEELTIEDEEYVKTDKVAPRGSTPNSSQNRDSAMSNRDDSLADLPPRPHTAWDDWKRSETPRGEAHSRTISGSIAQGDSRRRTLSLEKDLPRLPDSAFLSQQVLNYPQTVRQSQSHPNDSTNSLRNPFWKVRTKSRRVDQREAGSPSQTRSVPLGAQRHETTPPGVGSEAVSLQTFHTRALVRPGTPMPASETSMPLLLASALLSQQASQILIELSSISIGPSARENDSSGRYDKLDVFKSRMRELAAEGNDVGRGLMDCVLGSAPDLPHGQTAGNALKRARSDLGGTKRGPMPDNRSRRISLPLDVHYDRPPHDAYQVHRPATSHGDYPEVERRGEIRQMQVMLDQAQETIRGLQATLDVLRPNVAQGGFERSSETERVRRRRTFWGGWSRK